MGKTMHISTSVKRVAHIIPSFESFFLAVEKLQKTLFKITSFLEKGGIPYAVIGGNAVAAWVASVDESAVRTTKDIDLMFNRDDMANITNLFENMGFIREDLKGLTIFVDAIERNRRTGIHVVIAGDKVRPSYLYPAPDLSEIKKSKEGFIVIDLLPLIKMKLTSFRDKDRVHVGDMLSVGLITGDIKKNLPPDLLERLETVEKDYKAFDDYDEI